MPPYVINFPKCDWCGTTDNVWKCRSCGKMSCGECFRGMNTSDRCTHEKKEIPKSDDWQSSLEQWCEENLLDKWQGYS